MMCTHDISTHLKQLEEEFSQLLSPIDVPLSWTGLQINQYEQRRSSLQERIVAIRSSLTQLIEVNGEIAHLTSWRTLLETWLEQLSAEKLTRGRALSSKDLGVLENLQLSIQWITDGRQGRDLITLRLGNLMQEAGIPASTPLPGQRSGQLPWLGSLPTTLGRLEDLDRRRVSLTARLEEALLTDEEREQKAKDELARAAAANAKPQRKRRGDGTLYDKYPDGRCVEVDDVVEIAEEVSSCG